jgi:sodium-dependent phosphate cotransporter
MIKVKNQSNLSGSNWLTWTAVFLLVYVLLVGVGVIGDGFKSLSGGADGAEKIFAFASNPIIGVILGIMATALVQSSSTVTSVIVGLVAGGVPIGIAIPMIMGANMGTTITNTIVSLGNLRDSAAFGKSFQAATVHDFFNLYCILIFLPIELLFHPLEKLAGVMAGWFYGGTNASIKDLNFVGAITKPLSKAIAGFFEMLPGSFGAILTIVTGIALIILSVLYLGKLLRKAMTGRAQHIVDRSVGRGPLVGVASGGIVTVLVQSSSTTTSLIVPLAGSGVLTLRQVFPFTMGANIGTCITSLLAATAVVGAYQLVALQIALVHLLFNVFGVLLFLFLPRLRDLPITSATWLGMKSQANRGWAFGYILLVFFILPGMVFGGQSMMGNREEHVVEAEMQVEQLKAVEEEIQREDMAIE